MIELHYTAPGGKHARRISTGLRFEGDRNSKAVIMTDAQRRQLAVAEALRKGRPLTVLRSLARGLEAPQNDDQDPETLTVHSALEMAFGPSLAGKSKQERTRLYQETTPGPDARFARWTEHAIKSRARADDIEALIGADVPWASLSRGVYQTIWRAPSLTPKMAHRAVLAMSVAMSHVATHRTTTDHRPPRGWKALWERDRVPEAVDRHHHKPSEAGVIIRHLWDLEKGVDPSLRLLLLIGLEARMSQVLKSMRSHVVSAYRDGPLDPKTMKANRPEWLLKPTREQDMSRNKNRAPIFLLCYPPNYRVYAGQFLEQCWATGHLAEQEAAFRQNNRCDYLLLPHDETYYTARFHELEELAGVERVKGRGFRGLRRAITSFIDPAIQECLSERRIEYFDIKPLITHHAGKGIVQKLYEDKLLKPRLYDAAVVRERLRELLAAKSLPL